MNLLDLWYPPKPPLAVNASVIHYLKREDEVDEPLDKCSQMRERYHLNKLRDDYALVAADDKAVW